MKSPRRIVLTDEIIARHNLCTDPPPSDSLFWLLWNTCIQTAQQALQTPFIQGVKAGTLDPVVYGGFNVNDAYYCFNGAPDYQSAAQRASDVTLQQFLTAKYNSYQTYNATFPQIWRVKDATSIIPFDVCQQYSQFESYIATKFDPIYCLIAMLPCECLWAWLGEQLSPPDPQNLYAPWVNGNNDFSGAYAIGNFLQSYQIANPGVVDQSLSLKIYSQAMIYEQQNFAAALSATD
ncbi:putative transcriptional activator, TenA family [Pirellula staleyi DSM 6068]|uniref:Putative transcriptional activator, TenA family n=1 Tax=Pirellula staleyi (strain ATCC 27377 / DSM 6068 / ICPB 4128) TaxID=530564 RepID=D2R375_PIRSD|nr:TenA family transcriptional regulator [Pirellula staleyi]ADB15106.1 putative transcriptional activator, TenA family [Pirellula staleyi DSM 6068]